MCGRVCGLACSTVALPLTAAVDGLSVASSQPLNTLQFFVHPHSINQRIGARCVRVIVFNWRAKPGYIGEQRAVVLNAPDAHLHTSAARSQNSEASARLTLPLVVNV